MDNEKKKILIVDDDVFARESIEALIKKEGYDLNFAENGFDALKKAQEIIPDLILLDVMLPDMDGFEVCRKLRDDGLLKEIPIVFITALDDRDSRLEGIKAGGDDFLSKPYDRTELRLRIKTIIRLDRYRHLLNEKLDYREKHRILKTKIESFFKYEIEKAESTGMELKPNEVVDLLLYLKDRILEIECY